MKRHDRWVALEVLEEYAEGQAPKTPEEFERVLKEKIRELFGEFGLVKCRLRVVERDERGLFIVNVDASCMDMMRTALLLMPFPVNDILASGTLAKLREKLREKMTWREFKQSLGGLLGRSSRGREGASEQSSES